MTTRPTTSLTVRSASVRGGRRLVTVLVVAVAAFSCVLPACAWAADSTRSHAESFAKRVDIGGGRMMYIECNGNGSPTVLLISGTDTASDLWHAADQKGPTVYDEIQKTTRVCAYDRPGALHLDQTFSRIDPVPQPTSPQEGVDDLVALLKAADVPGPYVGRLQQGDEVVDALLGTGRLGHRVAPAKGLVEVERTGSVVGAHPRRLLDFVVDRRTLLISSVPEVGRRVRTRDEQDGGRSVAITLDVHHPASADVDPLGERLGVRPGRVGSPSASGQHTREGGDGDDEHGHKPATAADGGRAHCEGRCWTCSHDLLIAIVGG